MRRFMDPIGTDRYFKGCGTSNCVSRFPSGGPVFSYETVNVEKAGPSADSLGFDSVKVAG
jgi:hypothetical protein